MPAPQRSLYCVLLASAAKLFRDKKYDEAYDKYEMLANMTQDHASDLVAKRCHAAQRMMMVCGHHMLDIMFTRVVQSVRTEQLKRMFHDRRN